MTRLFWILPLSSLLLTSCGSSDDHKTEQLQSITVKQASGQSSARTWLSYKAGKLVQVRTEGMTAGLDDLENTEDDVLALIAVADCTIESGSNSLHDSYAEAHGISPLSIFFSGFQDCALPGLSADNIHSINRTAGADGKFLTADDGKGFDFTLSRISIGSRYSSPIPADTNCTTNCSGLDNIVYDPYAGIVTDGTWSLDTLYTKDVHSRVQAYSNTKAKTIYTRNADGRILTREFHTEPIPLPHPFYVEAAEGLVPTQLEEYEALSEGKTAVRQSMLLPSASYDLLGSSPTGQILLAVLLGVSTEPPIIASDGLSYYRYTIRHYRTETTASRLDRITLLENAGEDGIWNSADDVQGPQVILKYGIP